MLELGNKVTFRLYSAQVIPGIESVLEYMQPGGEVTCTIPAKYAYGEKGICIEVLRSVHCVAYCRLKYCLSEIEHQVI
jgi:FKBP-type peptidyl-prolyl cis-trans isomerase